MGLFFSKVCFLSYRPGSRNVKPDALSWQSVRDEDPVEDPKTILPPPCVVALLTWDVKEKVRATTAGQPGPSLYLDNQLYIPAGLRSEVWSGDTPLDLCAVQGPNIHVDYTGRDSGGFPWRMMFRIMSEPASPTTNTNTPARPQWDSFNLCRFLVVHGPTFQ